jgi:uncharacterized protein (TIGR02722 family)
MHFVVERQSEKEITMSPSIRQFAQGLLLVGLAVLLVGCTGTVTRRPVDDEMIKTANATEVDERSMCQKMARELIDLPIIANAKSPPTIAFLEISNRTTQAVDSYNLLSSIRIKLLQYGGGKFVFLDRERSEKLQQERRLKRTGQVTTSGNQDLYGADFFLSGRAFSEERRDGRTREVYYRYSFSLTNAETSAIVWEGEYEFKKSAELGTAFR